MCSGAIYWVGIPAVVFGCSAETAGRITDSPLVISCREIFAKGGRYLEVIGPILEAEGIPILERFLDNIVHLPSDTGKSFHN
jgi:tRNA(Arg) A34 adenosine deaminase TadA